MQIFNSGFFWFVEGILFCVTLLAVRAWSQDRSIPLLWWKWLALMAWVFLAGFTIAFTGTSLGENEPTAAIRGGLLFGLVVVLSSVALWRLWMVGVGSGDSGTVAEP